MLSLPHLVVLFVLALVIFGPEKLPELARRLGKATAEFRKMTNDFRYALEDEMRDLDRQNRIRDEEIASATNAVKLPPIPPVPPEYVMPRESPAEETASRPEGDNTSHADASAEQPASTQTVSAPQEKSPDDNPAV
jgi:sec-independent protein translocase protein TatB